MHKVLKVHRVRWVYRVLRVVRGPKVHQVLEAIPVHKVI